MRVTSMKKQKTSKQISDNYEANFSAVPDDVDYDEYIRLKKQAEYEETLEEKEEDITKKPLSEKRKAARKRIEITKEKEELARKNLEETPLEKNDVKALIIAGFLTMGIPTIIILCIIFGVGYLIFKLMGM